MSLDIRGNVMQSVIDYARRNHEKKIEEAYEYFWEEEYPEDFLSGTALELAFLNFEDWLVCDYRDGEGRSIIDAFIADESPDDQTKAALISLKESYISIYEVVSINGTLSLKDLALGTELSTTDSAAGMLRPGHVFASRFVESDDGYIMSRCIYPYNQDLKDTAMKYIENQFGRYIRNKRPGGSMRGFLKEESYIFNLIWLNSLIKKV